MTTKDLKISEFIAYYQTYVGLVPKDLDLLEGITKGEEAVVAFFKAIPSEKLNYKYAEGKWTVKEIFQHLIDTERIFQHRCFRISRHDKTPIAGFEQDDYIVPSQANNKSLESLIEEFKTVRQSFIVLIKNLSDTDLEFLGNANGGDLSARATVFITLGHCIWHINVIKERYL